MNHSFCLILPRQNHPDYCLRFDLWRVNTFARRSLKSWLDFTRGISRSQRGLFSAVTIFRRTLIDSFLISTRQTRIVHAPFIIFGTASISSWVLPYSLQTARGDAPFRITWIDSCPLIWGHRIMTIHVLFQKALTDSSALPWHLQIHPFHVIFLNADLRVEIGSFIRSSFHRTDQSLEVDWIHFGWIWMSRWDCLLACRWAMKGWVVSMKSLSYRCRLSYRWTVQTQMLSYSKTVLDFILKISIWSCIEDR